MYFLLSRSISLICKSCDAGPCLFFVILVRSFIGLWTWKKSCELFESNGILAVVPHE